jgi:hypothetical protein
LSKGVRVGTKTEKGKSDEYEWEQKREDKTIK